ncbi:unnamed protein product, partial [Rotaria sp. Silwood2]
MPINEDYTIKVKTKSHSYNLNNNSMDITNEYPMSENPTHHQKLTKTEYSSIGSSHKLNLLLQRSLRYSYRQRCCGCCPTILCEVLFPLIIMALLALARYGSNALIREMNENPNSASTSFGRSLCSQNMSTIKTTLSKDLFSKCFKFPPSYKRHEWPFLYSNRTNIIFQPMTNETEELVTLAKTRLTKMNCNNTKISHQSINDVNDTYLLQNEEENTIIIDFGSTLNLKNEHNIDYNIMVRMSNVFTKNTPVDMSFISFLHPTFILDRSNIMDNNNQEGSELPEFTDVKMFIDSLLIGYQTNKTIEFELERSPMICTPVRRDSIFESGSILVTTILILVDFIFIIPYLILLISLIREKNAKVKEILKVLGIEPILNNIAQSIRTLVILCLLTLLLCIVYKLKLKPDAFFNTVNFGILILGYLIYDLQLISFCIMNVQLFDKNVRAILGTFLIYVVSLIVFPYSIVWPTAIQYVLIFFSPYIAAHSLFQQAILHDLAKINVSVFRTIYRNVPMYFPTLIIMIASCIFYWALSWYLEKVFPGIYGIPLEWNFLFKRDYWRSETFNSHNHSFSNRNTSYSKTNSNEKSIVHVQHLIKKFGPDKIAVNDVSFNLYENQITSLLGPNGSGKTTIFNCLIGIYKQTSGKITIENDDGIEFDTRTNIDMLRKSMGYCPQHDILFDLLTIKEQLEFYATARGFGKNKEKIAKEMLYLVDLQASKDLYCNSLSGGMKRRLSLACAFVGDTKIILLDEPSSGLDPSNRRLLWDWLRSMKEGKTLLLTTHFMEESDALSDRIIIIANGNIKADGTSAKLKEQYGSGYKLVINKQNGCHTNDIKNELCQYLPKLKIETDILDGDVVFRTNEQPNELFIQALNQLEIMKKENRIKNYGIQNSTMDDVFLKITRDTKNDNESNSTSIDIDTIDKQCHYVFNDRQFLTGILYHLNQFYGLIIKTSFVRYRRWILTFIVLLLPILYNLLSNLISRSGDENGIFKMNLNSLNPQTILYHTDPIIEKYFRASIDGSILEQASSNISEMNQNIWQKRMDHPYTYTDIYLGFNIPKPIENKYTIQTLSSNLISGHEFVSLASNTFYKYILNDTSASIQTTLIYKNIGNFTAKPSVGTLMNVLSTASCFLKLLPTSLMLDVFIFYILFFYTTVFLISERKDSFLSLLNISGL